MAHHPNDFITRRFRMTQSAGAASAKMKHQGTRRLFEYWTDLTGVRSAPYRSEVTAANLGRDVAANAFVLENLGEGNIRFRVAGANLRDLFGLDPRGMSALSVFTEDQKPRFRALVEAALERPCLGLASCIAANPIGEETQLELLLAPLRSDFGEMNRVLGAFHVVGAPPAEQSLRRCRIQKAHTLRLEMDGEPELDAPLAGFAEPATGFAGKPALTAIEGGAAAQTEPRTGHLRVVTEDWPAAE